MDVATFLALAQGALNEGNIRAACEFYEAALAKTPDSVDTLEAYAEVFTHYMQEPERARQLLLHAVQVAPDEGHVKFLNLAQLSSGHAALGFYQHALRVARRAQTNSVNFELAREISGINCAMAELYLTDLCDEDDAPARCEELVEESIRCCDRNVEAFQTRASLKLSQGLADEARDDLLRAVTICKHLPEDDMPPYEAQIELGKLLMQVDPCHAFHFLLLVLNVDDSNPYVWFLLGETARLRSRFNDSARLLRRSRAMISIMNNGDEEALGDIDQAIRALVDEMGGAEAASAVPNLDHPNPIDLLEDSEEEWTDDSEADVEKVNDD